MNLQSESAYFAELRPIDRARLLNLLLHELAEEARGTYGPEPGQVHDPQRLRIANEVVHATTRAIAQLLADDGRRLPDDTILPALLAPRPDKAAERLVHNAYRRAIAAFDRYDTTVLMGS